MTNANEKFESNTTPSDNQTLFNATIKPTKTVPIIFLPGIMGSNLLNDQGKKVWYPPNTGLGGGWELLSKVFGGSPESRQLDLNGKTTRVGLDGYIKLNDKILPKTFTEELALQRGWGSVFWDGYGQILMHLEAFLNTSLSTTINFNSMTDKTAFFGSEPWRQITNIAKKELVKMPGVNSPEPESQLSILKRTWNPTKPFDLLGIPEFTKLANYNYPVFAMGYNWLQDNSESAKDVIARLDSFVQPQIKKEFPNASFEKYIIITHSMGGLVARDMILDGGLKSKLKGVIHGVMPASGAPTVYKRFGNGWDGYEVTEVIKDYFAQVVFGATAKSLTPVLGNSPGAMSLLPFTNFKNNGDHTWLTLRARKLDGSIIEAKLPTDPEAVFEEVYMDTNSWWRMVNQDFLDPANTLSKKTPAQKGAEVAGTAGRVIGTMTGSIMDLLTGDDDEKPKLNGITTPEDVYIDNINIVKIFQDKIKDSYFENTYAHYGNDINFRAFHEVIWETEERIDVQTAEELLNYDGTTPNRSPTQYDSATDTYVIPTVNINNYWYKKLFKSNGERCISRKNQSDVIFKLHRAPTNAGAGDGTVCHQSAADVQRDNVKQVFVINGYDHANSYKNEQVKSSVLYCIGKIMQTA